MHEENGFNPLDHLNRCRKAFDNIKHPSMIKALMKLGKGMYFNIIKAVYDKLIANITLNGEKLKRFQLKSGM
jgi:hypothetical protein